MKAYSQLRAQIYAHELKQMLPAVAQLFAFLLSILYLAIPASILTALISLSVIADINTLIEQRIIYQWVYFILLYFLIRIQKNAILGTHYQHYLASLPISVKLKHINTVLLTLAAGNLLLLAPIFLLIFIPDWTTFISQLHFPLFALSALMVAWLSLKNETLPWLSLFFTPLVLLLGVSADSLSAIRINSALLVLLVIEVYYEPFAFITHKSWRVTYYWQIRWLDIIKKPANLLIRILFCALFIGMVAYVQYQMNELANYYIQILFCWALALIIGSYQFDNEKFYDHYPHYLNGLLNQYRLRYCVDVLPAMCITLISCMAMYLWLHFSTVMILLLPCCVLLTIVSVSKFGRNFIILPSLLSALLMFL
ncbi:MAG: hypothetical protein ACI9LM_005163 [Alteromonadaceae bacterium]|jgi:hypothetical protein